MADRAHEIELHADDMRWVRFFASKAKLGGKSQVHTDRDTRQAKLGTDQLIGQIGQAAYSKFLFGSMEPYKLSRWRVNQHPHLGDKGFDFLGLKLDVKCSKMRASPDPLTYRMMVKPDERHDGWLYMQALVRDPDSMPVTVYLVGWAMDDELPPLGRGDWPETHWLWVRELHDLPPMMWHWSAVNGR